LVLQAVSVEELGFTEVQRNWSNSPDSGFSTPPCCGGWAFASRCEIVLAGRLLLVLSESFKGDLPSSSGARFARINVTQNFCCSINAKAEGRRPGGTWYGTMGILELLGVNSQCPTRTTSEIISKTNQYKVMLREKNTSPYSQFSLVDWIFDILSI
jgi:hypothetical protein